MDKESREANHTSHQILGPGIRQCHDDRGTTKPCITRPNRAGKGMSEGLWLPRKIGVTNQRTRRRSPVEGSKNHVYLTSSTIAPLPVTLMFFAPSAKRSTEADGPTRSTKHALTACENPS